MSEAKILCTVERESPKAWDKCKLRRPCCYPLFSASLRWKAFVLITPTPNMVNRTNEKYKRMTREEITGIVK